MYIYSIEDAANASNSIVIQENHESDWHQPALTTRHTFDASRSLALPSPNWPSTPAYTIFRADYRGKQYSNTATSHLTYLRAVNNFRSALLKMSGSLDSLDSPLDRVKSGIANLSLFDSNDSRQRGSKSPESKGKVSSERQSPASPPSGLWKGVRDRFWSGMGKQRADERGK